MPEPQGGRIQPVTNTSVPDEGRGPEEPELILDLRKQG
jgi:hypothetical protein